MEMNENFYKVLEPLVNQLLFGSQNKPTFNLEKSELSKDFTNLIINKEDKSFDKLIEEFGEKQITKVLKGLNLSDRIDILKIILSDEIFNKGIVLINLLQMKDISLTNEKAIVETIELEVGDYILSGDLGSNIILYFKLYFNEMFNLPYSKNDTISKNEYLDLLSKFTNERTII